MTRSDPLLKLLEQYFVRRKIRDCIDLLQTCPKENQSDLEVRLLFARSFKNFGQHEDALTQVETIRQFAATS
jgi:protein involved in temperature-dependent protein secretion